MPFNSKLTKMTLNYVHSSTSDTVNHDQLLNFLEYVGAKEVVLDIFKSYLNKRTQCVKINRYLSSRILCTNFDVPHTTAVEPTFFSTYINKLLNVNL